MEGARVLLKAIMIMYISFEVSNYLGLEMVLM